MYNIKKDKVGTSYKYYGTVFINLGRHPSDKTVIMMSGRVHNAYLHFCVREDKAVFHEDNELYIGGTEDHDYIDQCASQIALSASLDNNEVSAWWLSIDTVLYMAIKQGITSLNNQIMLLLPDGKAKNLNQAYKEGKMTKFNIKDTVYGSSN